MEALHELFEDIYDEVIALPDTPHAGLAYWRKQKLFFSSIPLTDLEWVNVDESFNPHDSKNEFYIDDDGLTIATPLHFYQSIEAYSTHQCSKRKENYANGFECGTSGA